MFYSVAFKYSTCFESYSIFSEQIKSIRIHNMTILHTNQKQTVGIERITIVIIRVRKRFYFGFITFANKIQRVVFHVQHLTHIYCLPICCVLVILTAAFHIFIELAWKTTATTKR